MSDIGLVLEKVRGDRPLGDILAEMTQLSPDTQFAHEDVRAISQYVHRLGVRSSDLEVRPLVAFLNRLFIAPMFSPLTVADYEPKALVFGLSGVMPPETIRSILDPLVHAPGLETVRLLAQKHGESAVLDVLAAVAGRTRNDFSLEANAIGVGDRLARAWQVADAAVEGTAPAPEAVADPTPEPRRPIELRRGWKPEGAHGWAQLLVYVSSGLPYEFMLLQRMVGTPFGTAQNRSSEQVADYLTNLFLFRYAEAVGLPFLRATDGPARPYPPYVPKSTMEEISGVTPSPDIAFLRKRGSEVCDWHGRAISGYSEDVSAFRGEDVIAVVEAKVASDGGQRGRNATSCAVNSDRMRAGLGFWRWLWSKAPAGTCAVGRWPG